MENTKSLLEEALKLDAVERASLIEGLIQSLDESDKEINTIWVKEAEKRLDEYRAGNLDTVTYEELFGEES
jgi:putative addiction module component (TIGR02574 family)